MQDANQGNSHAQGDEHQAAFSVAEYLSIESTVSVDGYLSGAFPAGVGAVKQRRLSRHVANVGSNKVAPRVTLLQ
jgi:hypothetical protein